MLYLIGEQRSYAENLPKDARQAGSDQRRHHKNGKIRIQREPPFGARLPFPYRKMKIILIFLEFAS